MQDNPPVKNSGLSNQCEEVCSSTIQLHPVSRIYSGLKSNANPDTCRETEESKEGSCQVVYKPASIIEASCSDSRILEQQSSSSSARIITSVLDSEMFKMGIALGALMEQLFATFRDMLQEIK